MLRPSRIGAILLAVATIATAGMLAFLPGDRGLRAGGVVLSGACGLFALRGGSPDGARSSIASVEVAVDGCAIVTERSGRRIAAVIRPESYVGAWLTTLVLRPEGARRSRAVVIWPDTMPPDEFRRLRVLLRHGQRAEPNAAR